jgi:hypothetical protein
MIGFTCYEIYTSAIDFNDFNLEAVLDEFSLYELFRM